MILRICFLTPLEVRETSEARSGPFPHECPLLFQVINYIVSNTRRDHSICSLPGSQKRLLNANVDLPQEDISEVFRELSEFIRLAIEDSFRARNKLQELIPPLLHEDPPSSTVCGVLQDATKPLDDRTFMKDFLFTIYSLEDDGENPWSKESYSKDVYLNKYKGDTEIWPVSVFDKEERLNEDDSEEKERKEGIVDSVDHIESNYGMTVATQIPKRKIGPHFAIFISHSLLLLLLASLFLMIFQFHRNTWYKNPIQLLSDLILGTIHIALLMCKASLLWATKTSARVPSPVSHLARARFLSS